MAGPTFVFAAAALAITGFLVACGASGPVGRLNRAQHLAQIEAKHVKAQLGSLTPVKTLARQAHASPRTSVAASLRGSTSSAQTNGRVVGMIDAWVPAGAGAYNRVTYVAYSFLSDALMDSQTLPNPHASVTEVWRYAQQTWCPVVTGLNLNLTALQLRQTRLDATSGALTVDFFTGSADGRLGKIAFTDAAPNADICDSSRISPVEATTYTLLPGLNLDNTSPVQGMRSLDIHTQDSSGVLTPTGEKVLYAWVGGSCNSPADFNVKSGLCAHYRNGGLLRYRYGTAVSAAPDSGVVLQVMKPEDIGSDYPGDCKLSGLSASGLGAGPLATDGSGRNWFSSIPRCAANAGDTRSSATSGTLVGAALVSFDGLLIQDAGAPTRFGFQYVAGTNSNRVVSAQGSSDVDSANRSTTQWSTSRLNINPVNGWCQGTVYGDVFGKVAFPAVCTGTLDPTSYPKLPFPDSNLNGATYWSPTNGNFNDLPVTQLALYSPGQAQTGTRYPAATAIKTADMLSYDSYFISGGGLQVTAVYARDYSSQPSDAPCAFADGASQPNPCQAQVASGNLTTDASGAYSAERALARLEHPLNPLAPLDPSKAVLFKARATSAGQVGALALQLDAARVGNPNAGNTGLIPQLGTDFSQRNSAAVSMSVAKSIALAVPVSGMSAAAQQLYWFSMVTDRDPAGDTASLSTRGGIALCVAGMDGAGKYNLAACQNPRAASGTNPEGNRFASANLVTNNATYLSTPVAMSYTVSPDNQVFVNYVAANGGIFTLNATNPRTDWGNWTRISAGRNSQCSQTLKLPPTPTSDSPWASILFSLFETAYTALLPEPLGLLIDISLAVAEPLIEGSSETVSVYNGVALQRDCKLGS